MDALKKFFPLSWKFTKDPANLVIGIIIYVAASIVAGLLVALAVGLAYWIPILGVVLAFLFGSVGSAVTFYSYAGIVILILVYCKVIKN